MSQTSFAVFALAWRSERRSAEPTCRMGPMWSWIVAPRVCSNSFSNASQKKNESLSSYFGRVLVAYSQRRASWTSSRGCTEFSINLSLLRLWANESTALQRFAPMNDFLPAYDVDGFSRGLCGVLAILTEWIWRSNSWWFLFSFQKLCSWWDFTTQTYRNRNRAVKRPTLCVIRIYNVWRFK